VLLTIMLDLLRQLEAHQRDNRGEAYPSAP
jgi:hypothetical protein